MITKNRQDYLRAIFCLSENKSNEIKSIDIVNLLNVSKPAVSEMLDTLKKEKYIKKTPYSHISFTKKGFEEAKKITYKHRVIEFFLKEILHFTDKEMHEEAHLLEHAMSDKFAKKLSKFLKNPKICPCGNKIPNIEW